MNTLFKTRYIPENERDLARYILEKIPFARESPAVFMDALIEHVLDIELTPEQKARLSKFSPVDIVRRKQELLHEWDALVSGHK